MRYDRFSLSDVTGEPHLKELVIDLIHAKFLRYQAFFQKCGYGRLDRTGGEQTVTAYKLT